VADHFEQIFEEKLLLSVDILSAISTTGMSGAGLMAGIQTERATGIHSMPLVCA
jgi:hypothetical protein